MVTISLLDQAKVGDAAAIATLMNQALQPKGISVRCDRQDDCLQLWLTGDSLPPQGPIVAYVQRGLERLQIASVAALHIYAEQTSQQNPGWGVEVVLGTVPPEVRPLPLDGPEQSTPAPESPQEPILEPVAEASPMPDPGTIAYAYALLGLELGDSLQNVEGTYFKVKALALREGDRAKVDALKQAFHQLKEHIENPPAKVDEPSIEAKDPSFSTAEDESLTPVEQVEKLLKQRRVLAQVNIQGDKLCISWLAVRVTNAEGAAKQVHALLAHQNLASIGLHGIKTLVVSALSRDHVVVWQQTYPLTKS